jgi:hypothetical protein
MNRLERLFIPLENGDIQINKPELTRHPLLRPLIVKQKSKEQVDRLMYVYLMSDIGSMYNHLLGDEKYQAVKAHFGYDDLWKPTPDMTIAVETYEKLMDLSPTGRAYKTALTAVYETGKDLDKQQETIVMLKGSLTTRINDIKNTSAFTESEKMNNIKEAMAYMTEIATIQKELIKNLKDLPALIELVKNLAAKFALESSNKEEIHGGGELGNRE